MKLQATPLFLVLIGSVNVDGLCLKNALNGLDSFAEDPSLGADDGLECSLRKVKNFFNRVMENLDDCGTLNEELVDVFGTRNSNALRAIIQEACDDAEVPSNVPTKSFHDILDLVELNVNHHEDLSSSEVEDRFLKEYYDGNTFLNQEVGNPTGRNAFGMIKDFDREHAQKEVVAWPSEDIDNFDSCEMNTAMCCWVTDRVVNNGNNNGDCKRPMPNRRGPGDSNCIDADPADNTDLCYVDHNRSPQANHVAGGFSLFPGDVEGAVHCHGFIWADDDEDESSIYKANNLFYVSMEDHLRTRGYVRNVPGAPMCGCLEQMPTVSRADCTQTSHEYLYDFTFTEGAANPLSAVIIGRDVNFDACDGETANDLLSKYEQMVDNGDVEDNADFYDIVVGEGNCEEETEAFLGTKGFQKIE